MYDLCGTIIAISSPTGEQRVIVRISGPAAIEVLNQVFTPSVSGDSGITPGKISNIDATVYLFRQPHSYTGDDLAEIHSWANPAATEDLIQRLLALGARSAEPGEFTARAYFNGKIDLTQAEAVNEIISCSNRFQLAAAEKLLAGSLGQATGQIGSSILDCLSEIEAGLDFSSEDVEQSPAERIVDKLKVVRQLLDELLVTSIRCEAVVDLPSAGIAGAPSAGKSALLNTLLGKSRSIVSAEPGTTRDVLTGELMLEHNRCIIFDCAGLMVEPQTVLDNLAQRAGIEALRNAAAVVFCVDILKKDWGEDLDVLRLLKPGALIPVATKTDLCDSRHLSSRLSQLGNLFGADFLPLSAKTGYGISALTERIDSVLLAETRDGREHGSVAMTSRHRHAVADAVDNIEKAIAELKTGGPEIAAVFLRAAHQAISGIERHDVAEDVLARIFSRFCIGK